MNAVRMVDACMTHQVAAPAMPYELHVSEVIHWIGEVYYISEWGGLLPWVAIKEEIWNATVSDVPSAEPWMC